MLLDRVLAFRCSFIVMKKSLDARDRNALRVHEYASGKRIDRKQLDTDGSVPSDTVRPLPLTLSLLDSVSSQSWSKERMCTSTKLVRRIGIEQVAEDSTGK
jgi:hypothetical protein